MNFLSTLRQGKVLQSNNMLISTFLGEQTSDEEKEVEYLDEAANEVEDEQTEVNDVSDEEEQDEDEDEEQGNHRFKNYL